MCKVQLAWYLKKKKRDAYQSWTIVLPPSDALKVLWWNFVLVRAKGTNYMEFKEIFETQHNIP